MRKVTVKEVKAGRPIAKLVPIAQIYPSCQVLPRHVPLRECPDADEAMVGDLARAGCVIMAGGEGTRLGFEGPKGLFPLQGRTLFAHLCEPIAGSDRFVAVMTSPLNDAATRDYFKRCGNFGLTNLHFFCQTLAPLLDEQGREGAMAPDGNGSLFRAFVGAGLADRCREEGIRELQLAAIDNPRSYLFDPILIGFHQQQGADATVSCVRRGAGDSMGLLVDRNGLGIVEYSEVKPETLAAPLYPYGNAGRWVVDLDLLVAVAGEEMPWHWAHKRGMWKRERFLIDLLLYAKNARALCFSRERSYAPIKSLENVLSFQT